MKRTKNAHSASGSGKYRPNRREVGVGLFHGLPESDDVMLAR
jgi:hypothetical protein